MAEETRGAAGRQPLGAGEHLKRDLALGQARDLGEAGRFAPLADQREVAETRSLGHVACLRGQGDADHVADDREHPVVLD